MIVAVDRGQSEARDLRMAVAFTVAVLFAVLLLNGACFGNLTHDFAPVYAGATIVRQGHGFELYSLNEQAKVQAALFPGRPFMAYNHPPFEALFFAPLTALSYTWAYMVWGAINIALWVLFVIVMRSYVPVPRQTFQYLILGFTFFPLWRP